MAKARNYVRRDFRSKNEKVCNGALCRGEKKFISINGSHYCKRCKDYISRIHDPEVEFGSAQGSRPKR